MNCWSTARDFGVEKRRYLEDRVNTKVLRNLQEPSLVKDGGKRPGLEPADTSYQASCPMLH